MKDIQIDAFRYDGSAPFRISDAPTKIDDIYESDEDYEQLLRQNVADIDEWQTRLYEHNRYGLLTVFQAMDAAGKDGTIQHVFTGTNPLGLRVHSFKRPTELELEHDFLWRCWRELPERGMIGIFNRSYYEEVLVAKVHPNVVTENQRLPEALVQHLDHIWQHRYASIRHMEQHLHHNGFPTVKFFLHVSKKEQAKRLIARIKDINKNWKFDEGDVAERNHWADYQQAYEAAINETAAPHAPWYVVPADDKKNMRLIVGRILIEELKKLPIKSEKPDVARFESLQSLIDVIQNQ